MLNHVQVIGHLGKDPEVRVMTSGDAVCNFSVATTEKWKDKQTGETKEATEWHRINLWGKLAEVAGKYLKKGSLVYVSGKIVTRKWTDQSGAERYSTEIKADAMKMLGGKGEGSSTSSSTADDYRAAKEGRAAPPSGPVGGFDGMDDDIPF